MAETSLDIGWSKVKRSMQRFISQLAIVKKRRHCFTGTEFTILGDVRNMAKGLTKICFVESDIIVLRLNGECIDTEQFWYFP
jgi:hypothetical protein